MKPESPNNNESLFPDRDFDVEDEQSWQVSYLDIVTILLGFLFVLLALTNMNQLEISSVSKLFKSSSNETEFITTPIEDIKKELEKLLQDEIEAGKLEIVRDLNDLRIRFSSDDLYKSGSTKLQLGASRLLDQVLAAIKKLRHDDFYIDVEGHTDNTPIATTAYPSNWELSTARASNIVKYFSERGIANQRLKASGYADSRPRVPNEDSLGNPIPKNKDLNRRIVLRLYYSTADEQKEKSNPSILAQNQQADSSVACKYAIQVGGFKIFENGISMARLAEERTDYEFTITYNRQIFSVRTLSTPSFSEALDNYRTIANNFEDRQIGLIHQCYSNEKKIPPPIDYVIQFGAFSSKDNAQEYRSRLSREYQISAHLAESTSQYFKVVSGPYESTESATAYLKRYKNKQLPDNIFLDYVADTTVKYKFNTQLQLASFSQKEKARNFSREISNKLDIKTSVTTFGEGSHYVVTRAFQKWSNALKLYNRIEKNEPSLSPVIYLLEYS